MLDKLLILFIINYIYKKILNISYTKFHRCELSINILFRWYNENFYFSYK